MAPFLTVHSPVFDCVQPVRVLPSNMETRFGSPNGLVGARVSAEAFTAGTATAAARTAPAASIQKKRRDMRPRFHRHISKATTLPGTRIRFDVHTRRRMG